MSYEAFKARVNALIERSGTNENVRFLSDDEKGKYSAVFPDGTKIIGNAITLKVTVLWGSGHASMATI